MFIMFADITYDVLTPEEIKCLELMRKISFLDSMQLKYIGFKKIFFKHKMGREKYIKINNLRKNVLEYLKFTTAYKVKRYTKRTGEFYYYIYF